MKALHSSEGFTLVELMVVVLIIGILVAIAIPVFNAAQANAKLKTCQANQRIVEGAIQNWRCANTTNNPATFAGLLVQQGTAAGDALIGNYLNLKDVPICPAAGAGANRYHLDATGATVDGDESAATWTSSMGVDHVHY